MLAVVIAAALILPVHKKTYHGHVIEEKDSCILLRLDDHREKWFCDVEADRSSQIELHVFSSLMPLKSTGFTLVNVIREADAISRTVQKMSLKEKLGQMMVIRAPENLHQTVDFVPGGIILFGNDFEGKNEEEIAEMTADLKSNGAFLMVDEEGGSVSRVSKALNEEVFPSVQELFQQGGWQAVEDNLKEKSALLKKLGLDVNLNPVADVCENPEAFIYARSFGKDARMTAEYAAKAVQIQKQEGLLSCLKHFPGYGSNVDTHTGFSVDFRELKEYQQYDFLPFEAGMKEGAELLMMSHIIMMEVDELPASLSKSVHELVRNELNYEGLIITDDLMMDAIEDMEIDPLLAALNAGNDLLLTTDPEVSLASLLKASQEGLICLNQVDESVIKILELKEKMKILEMK